MDFSSFEDEVRHLSSKRPYPITHWGIIRFHKKWILSYKTGKTAKFSELEYRRSNICKCCKELILNCLRLFGTRVSSRYSQVVWRGVNVCKHWMLHISSAITLIFISVINQLDEQNFCFTIISIATSVSGRRTFVNEWYQLSCVFERVLEVRHKGHSIFVQPLNENNSLVMIAEAV